METIKGFGVLCVWVCFGIVAAFFVVLGLIFIRDSIGHGNCCFDCEEGMLAAIPEADYVSVQTLFGKEQLRCTHCGSENIKGIQW